MNDTSPRILSPRDPEEAFAWIDEVAVTPETERVASAGAVGRQLVERVSAQREYPERAQCIREGYAVRSADTVGAGDYSPLALRLVGQGPSLGPNQCARVAPGQALPDAADAVLGLDSVQAADGFIEIPAAVAPGDGVLPAGAQCRVGQDLFAPGHRLRPVDLAMLRIAGVDGVPVRRLPRVKIIAVAEGNEPTVAMVQASVSRDAGVQGTLVTAPDAAAFAKVVAHAADADVALFVGGSGIDESDVAWRWLTGTGAIDVDGVAIHPGGGAALGRIGQCPFVLLPGGPVAGFAAYELLGARLLRRACGRPEQATGICTLPLARKLVSRIGLLEMARVRIRNGLVEPLATQEDQLLQTVTAADGFVLIAPASEGFPAGSDVQVHCFSPCADSRVPD